jgi:hypothetical protein
LSSQLKADFIDEDDKTLISTDASAFRDLPEMASAIRKYLNLNKSIKLYPLMKKCDTRDLGVAKSDQLVKELGSVGIKFGNYDEKNFLKWAPQDKLGNIKYQELYNQVMNISNQNTMTTFKLKSGNMEITENSTNSRKSKKYGMIASRDQRKPPPPKRNENMNTEEAEREQTLLQ